MKMIEKTVIGVLILCVFLCGCMTPLPDKTGTVKITSSPPGPEIYLDNEYHGTTPGTISAGTQPVIIWLKSVKQVTMPGRRT